jgi:hypothetical protein
VISHLKMRAAALEWLRFIKGCPIIAVERGPWSHLGHRPDVMAVTKKREFVEVEIKRSFSDFKHDAEKRIWQNRDLFKRAWPSFFHYYTPPDLVDRVLPLLRDGFGLITYDEKELSYAGLPTIVSVKRATRQKDAKPLTTNQLVRMVTHLSGSYVAAEASRAFMEVSTDDAHKIAV